MKDNRFLLSLNGSINKSELEDKRAEAWLSTSKFGHSMSSCEHIRIRVTIYKLNITA